MQCSLHYYDGTKLGAYIDSTGRLIANVPGAPTPNEVDYDPDRHLVRTTVTMTQALTQAEIKSGRRGNVHGGSNLPNNGRKVSHIVQESQTGRYEVCLLPRDVAQHSQHVMVQQDRLWNFSPHMGHEFKIRNRRRYSKDVAKHVQRFIKAAFVRAELDDHAARFALQRAWQLSVPKPQELLESTATNLANLLAVSSNAKERQEKHTNHATK